jgi:hypothetical protein
MSAEINKSVKRVTEIITNLISMLCGFATTAWRFLRVQMEGKTSRFL